LNNPEDPGVWEMVGIGKENCKAILMPFQKPRDVHFVNEFDSGQFITLQDQD